MARIWGSRLVCGALGTDFRQAVATCPAGHTSRVGSFGQIVVAARHHEADRAGYGAGEILRGECPNRSAVREMNELGESGFAEAGRAVEGDGDECVAGSLAVFGGAHEPLADAADGAEETRELGGAPLAGYYYRG